MTPGELEALIRGGESDAVEFKESAKGELREAVCAFANDLAARKKQAYLLVGVRDDGTLAGIDVDDELLAQLAQIRAGGDILPLPSISVERCELGSAACAVVCVQPSDDTPVRYRGRVWVRVGTTTQIASAQDERILIEKRRAGDVPFDHRSLRDTSLDDIDVEFFEREYLPAAYAPDVLEANGRSISERLRALRFSSPDGAITAGGLLVLGKDPSRVIPGAYIQFVAYDGTAVTEPILDQRVFAGRIDATAKAILEIVRLSVAIGLRIGNGLIAEPIARYPFSALRELVLNAIMHRDYQIGNTPIRVTAFADRVEIFSPGGAYAPVQSARFSIGGITAYRNPIVADALKTLNFVQKFGFGIPFSHKALEENKNPPPEFEVARDYVNVVVRGRSL